MKYFLLFLGMATFLGCQKFEASYHLNCQFENSVGFQRWLVVTDYKGRELGTEEIASGVSTFNGDFTTHDADSPDSFDVHLIYLHSTTHTYWVYSHLDVYNGSAVYINPVERIFSKGLGFYIGIKGVQSFISLKLFETTSVNNYEYDALQQQVKIYLGTEKGEGVVLRIKANDESFFRSLYLPDTALLPLDTTIVTWDAFLPESNTETVTFDKELSPGILSVQAVSPDFKHFVTLFNTNGTFSGTAVKFNRPAGIPDNWLYRVSGYQDGLFFDKMYQPNEPLFVSAYEGEIDGKLENGQLFLDAKAAFDVIRVSGSIQNPTNQNSHVYWLINGRPSSFMGYQFPLFEHLLPSWADPKVAFKTGFIRAAKFDSYDYEQVQAGFPYQLNERFSIPKSGFKERWANY